MDEDIHNHTNTFSTTIPRALGEKVAWTSVQYNIRDLEV